ncbi:helix-turn-helix domain-containing protein [Actinophytocola glycyrrhizae]|uniref:Helix-turn-helix transcriptional regulator n=1 Tax=Actinophytocola glycyrrhizae TaxID=2044873 RepID=A0ABV9S1Z5_9PSEU
MVKDAFDRAHCRAIGEELRRAREANNWSRGYLVSRLPSGIGDRTLLSYEHGSRALTMLRFIEVCHALGVGAPQLLGVALQRARLQLENLALQVDLPSLIADNTPKYRPLTIWARNKLDLHPGGIVAVVPAAVDEMATMMGSPHSELTAHLARFTPDIDHIPDLF